MRVVIHAGARERRATTHPSPNADPALHSDFESPPLVEAVLAVAFDALPLTVVGLSRVYEKLFRADFPRDEEQPYLRMPVERFDEIPSIPTLSFEMTEVLPPPRLWFLNESGTELVQLQRDWFARNWRSQEGVTAEYPHYKKLRGHFDSHLRAFSRYLDQEGKLSLQPTQCEITYINHIATADVLGLPDILSTVNRPAGLPEAETTQFASQYLITNEGTNVGRFHAAATPAVRKTDKTPLTVLTLTARGNPVGDGVDGVLKFLDLGHDWANRAFNALTRPAMHERWGKR